MFSSKNNKSSKVETLIAQGVEVSGDIKFKGKLRLEGTIKGNVKTFDDSDSSVLVISECGRLEGDIYVAYAIINGEVIGNVYTSEKLELSSNSRISGNVEYNLLQMASGSEVNGQMLYNARKKKLLEHKKEEVQDGIQHLDADIAVTKS